MTQELIDRIDFWTAKVHLLRNALKNAPELPSPDALIELSYAANDFNDLVLGKELQKIIGSERIPAKSECEEGAGFWLRLTGQTLDDFR